jgi:hypothetical protein
MSTEREPTPAQVESERIPSQQERFWARRLVLLAVVLVLVGVVVGGSASLYLFIAAMLCGLAAALCLRGTIDSGYVGGGDGGGPELP